MTYGDDRINHLAHSPPLFTAAFQDIAKLDIKAGTPQSLPLNPSFIRSASLLILRTLGTLLRTFVVLSNYLQTKLYLPRTSSSSTKGIMRPFDVIMAFAMILFSLAAALPEPLAIPEAVPAALPEPAKE